MTIMSPANDSVHSGHQNGIHTRIHKPVQLRLRAICMTPASMTRTSNQYAEMAITPQLTPITRRASLPSRSSAWLLGSPEPHLRANQTLGCSAGSLTDRHHRWSPSSCNGQSPSLASEVHSMSRPLGSAGSLSGWCASSRLAKNYFAPSFHHMIYSNTSEGMTVCIPSPHTATATRRYDVAYTPT